MNKQLLEDLFHACVLVVLLLYMTGCAPASEAVVSSAAPGNQCPAPTPAPAPVLTATVIVTNKLVGQIRIINGYCTTPGIGSMNLKLSCRVISADRMVCDPLPEPYGEPCGASGQYPLIYDIEAP